jgi:hypothetical protein
MPSTNRTTMFTRSSHCLAAAALMTGLAFTAAPIVSAQPVLNEVGYAACVAEMERDDGHGALTHGQAVDLCCRNYGGIPTNTEGTVPYCEPPDIEAEGNPTTKPAGVPSQVAPPAQGPGAPIGPVPIGPGPARG